MAKGKTKTNTEGGHIMNNKTNRYLKDLVERAKGSNTEILGGCEYYHLYFTSAEIEYIENLISKEKGD